MQIYFLKNLQLKMRSVILKLNNFAEQRHDKDKGSHYNSKNISQS